MKTKAARKRASAVDHKNQESLDVIGRIMKSSRGVKLEGKNTFQGIELCNWLIRAGYSNDVKSALQIADDLLHRGNVFESVNKNVSSVRYNESVYVFVNDKDEMFSSKSSKSNRSSSIAKRVRVNTQQHDQKKPGRFDRIFSKLEVISPERRDVGAIMIMLSYACGYFDFGFAAAILIFVGWCFFVSIHDRISEAHERKLILDNALERRDDKCELALIRLSPPWFRSADIERARWFNLFLKQMWHNGLSRSVDETVTELLDWKLEELRPSFIRSFKVKKCNFTTLRPHVMGVKVYRQSETDDDKSCMIDLDVEILSQDPKALVVSARLLTGPVQVAGGNIVLKGKLRLHFCEPFDYFMPFQLLNISFVTMPEIDFSLCALTKGFDLNKIGGVRSYISSVVNESLTDLMVWPNVYPYEMFDPLFEAKIQVAVLRVHMKSSHTTFVKISCAGYQKQTSASNQKLSPEFNEEFDFTVTDPKALLRIELWSRGSMFTTSRILGVLEITPLEQMRENVVDNAWHTMIHPKKSEKSTNIQMSLKIRWFKTISTTDDSTTSDLEGREKIPISSSTENQNSDNRSTKVQELETMTTTPVAPRKLSLLLNHIEEGDRVFQAYKIATRGSASLPTRFEGRAMYQFLFKYCGVTEKKEAMEICNRMLASGLIWDPSYLRLRKGRRVRVMSNSRKHEDTYPDGVITAVGSEGTEKVFVVTMTNKQNDEDDDNEKKIPAEQTCPIRQLIPYEKLEFKLDQKYRFHWHITTGRTLSTRSLRYVARFMSITRRSTGIASTISIDEAKRLSIRLLGTLSYELPCVVFRSISKLQELCCNSVQMKRFLCDRSILNKKRKNSNVQVVPSRITEYLELGNQEQKDAIGFVQLVTELCASLEGEVYSNLVRQHVVRLLRNIASFEEGVGFLRYWMHPNDLLILFSQPYDNLVSALALNAILHRLLAEKRLAGTHLPVPMICGFMYRKTGKKTSWRRRWFVITMDCLLEYSGDTSKTSKRTNLHRKTMLAGCVACISTEQYRNLFGNHFRTFEIHIPCGENVEEVFYFTAQNDIETQKWLVALDRAISRCNTQNGIRSSAFRTEENASTGMQRMKRKRDNNREIQRINSILIPESPQIGGSPADSNSSLDIPYRHRSSGVSSFPDPRVMVLNEEEESDNEMIGEKKEKDISSSSPPSLIVTSSSPSSKNRKAPCSKCQARFNSHSRACVKCGIVFCIRCKKTEMKKLGSKTWKCLEDCSHMSPSYRVAALNVSDEDISGPSFLARDRLDRKNAESQIGDAKEKSAFRNVTSTVMKLSRGFNKIVGIRDTEKKNFRSAEMIHASRLVHPDLLFISQLSRRANDKDNNILFRVKAARVIMHLFYYESHKINPKHDRLLRKEAVESAMSAIISALRSGPMCFGIAKASTASLHKARKKKQYMRQIASLMMDWNEVLDLFALGKAVVARTNLCKDKMQEYEVAVELEDSESRLVSLLEANYTLETKSNLNPHYRGLTELRDKIMIETEKRRSSLIPLPPSAPKNSSSRNSKKKRLQRYNSRKKSMFHAAKFASVNDELRRTVMSRSSSDGQALSGKSTKIRIVLRIMSAFVPSSISSNQKLCIQFTHHGQEFRTLSKMVSSSSSVVNWNQEFNLKANKKHSEILFVMSYEDSDSIGKGTFDLSSLSSDLESEGKFLERIVKLQLDDGKEEEISLKVSLKWKRRAVTSQYL